MTVADQYRLWVNGSLISETGPSWQTAETYTITLHARPYQANVIALEAKKVDPSEDGLDRGVIAAITLGNDVLVTDASWVGYEGSGLPASWVQADYDMGLFIPAVSYGDHGTLAPWGEVDANLNGAEWIWSSGADGAAGQKSDDQTLYLRRSFYVASGEVFLDLPSTCE